MDSDGEMTDGEDMGYKGQKDLQLYESSSTRKDGSPESVALDVVKTASRERRVGSVRYSHSPLKGPNKSISDETISDNDDESHHGSEGGDQEGNGHIATDEITEKKIRSSPSSYNKNAGDDEESDQYNSNCKNKYLRDLAAAGLRVGRHVPRMMKNISKGTTFSSTSQPPTSNPPNVKSRKGLNPRRQCQSPPSPAVDTLLRVFPTKSRTDVDLILSKTGGDVLKAIEVLLTVSESENLFMQHQAAAAHQHQQLHHHQHHQLNQTPMSVNQIIQQQQQIHHQQIHRSSRSCFSPQPSHNVVRGSSGPVDLAMDSHRLIDHHNNNNNNNTDLSQNHHNHHSSNKVIGGHTNNSRILEGNSPPRGESPPTAFPFFGQYTAAAAAAAAAAARFHASHPSSRQFLPTLLPYSIPGLPRPDFFHGGNTPGGPIPLVSAAAAAAMSSAVGMNFDSGSNNHVKRGSTNHNHNNASPGTPGSDRQNENVTCTIERESGTPPTSCSGSDRASYSE